jgi:hypothetical protein
MHTPECSELPRAFYLSDVPRFEARLEELEAGDWCRLGRCRSCGQLWRTDDWDKYVTQFAVKLDSAEHWRSFDPGPLEKKLLVSARGGTEPTPCAWAGCGQPVVRSSALCTDHLYEAGLRR